jgi:hypothetical protein
VIDTVFGQGQFSAMAGNTTRKYLGAQMERMLARQETLQEDMRVLTAIVLGPENTLVDMLQQIRAMVAQYQRFNDHLASA